MLAKSKVHKDKAVLTYRCPDAPPFLGGKVERKMAEISLVREGSNWKIAQEHFAPAKNILPGSALNI